VAKRILRVKRLDIVSAVHVQLALATWVRRRHGLNVIVKLTIVVELAGVANT
jgi:hypothetical protein